MHYRTFDQEAGRLEFREWANRILSRYGDGYELSPEGQVLHIPASGFGPLFDEPIATQDTERVTDSVEHAKALFLRHNATVEDKHSAVLALAGVLELHRARVEALLPKGVESDIFQLANQFAVRHKDKKQKYAYDREVWLEWMFYYYLASVIATLKIESKLE
jgi:hypothetical protein